MRVETECSVRHVQGRNEEEIVLEPTGPAVCIALMPDLRGNRVSKTSAFPNRVWARGGKARSRPLGLRYGRDNRGASRRAALTNYRSPITIHLHGAPRRNGPVAQFVRACA